MKRQERMGRVIGLLKETYPEGECELDYGTPWQLLVATILSAQCTDQRVNQVTSGLFERWPGPEEMASAPREELEETIRPTGFFRNKARSIQEAARQVLADHDGKVPQSLEDMVRLPGVGRKTAKVVLGEGFGIAAGVAVDTHVTRVSRRLGLTRHDDADKISADLESLAPQDEWVKLSMRMILHGRRVCTARKPACPDCTLLPVCANPVRPDA